MRSPHDQPCGQATSSKASEVVGEALEQRDDSGNLGALGGVEAVAERPPHVVVYRVLPAGKQASAASGDRGYHLPAVIRVLRPGNEPTLLEPAERGSDRLGRDALDLGQRPGRQRAKTVQTYQNRDLKEARIGGGVGRRVELAKPPADSTHGQAQVNRGRCEVRGCLGHGRKLASQIQVAKSSLPNLTYQSDLWYRSRLRLLPGPFD